MDKDTLKIANQLDEEIQHLEWFETEIIVRKNTSKMPLVIYSGSELRTGLNLGVEETNELTVLISDFLKKSISERKNKFKAL
jgi:hypothetical protein